jgi:pyrroloquinoline quinone biosynthesis protein B
MRLRILGSAAGGGLPQWNCACPNCTEARSASGRVRPRTQDGMALDVGDGAWVLVNASPDIHRQIQATPELWPAVETGGTAAPTGGRSTPIGGVILTNGDLDHTLGLFSLRENTPFTLYATEAVHRGLVEGNTMFRTLQRFSGQVRFEPLTLERPLALPGRDGRPSGVNVTAIPLPGKVAKHLEGLAAPSPEDNVGLWIHDTRSGKRLVVASSTGAAGDYIELLDDADACVFDGTFWSSDELVRLGLGTARAEDMAHLPLGGPSGSLALLAGVTARRKVFSHINNTNPILAAGSPERRAVEAAGWEVAEDGLVIEL